VVDAFELLEQHSAPVFHKLAALADQRILPSYSFVFVCHIDVNLSFPDNVPDSLGL
jgi:hypothetical protein